MLVRVLASLSFLSLPTPTGYRRGLLGREVGQVGGRGVAGRFRGLGDGRGGWTRSGRGRLTRDREDCGGRALDLENIAAVG